MSRGTVGLVGLVSNRLAVGGSAEERAKYRLADPFETAKKWVAELQKKKCQVIVVVAHMDLNDQEKLAGSVPGIHFILSGHYTYYHLDSYPVNETKIFMAGSRGENIGQVDFSLESERSLCPLPARTPQPPISRPTPGSGTAAAI